MKKVLILVLTLIMLLGLASVSLAMTVWLDTSAGGEYDTGSHLEDLSQVAIGFELPLDRKLKFTGNLASGAIDYYNNESDVSTSSILLKGGYALINDRQLRLDLTAGFYDRTITYDEFINDEESYYSVIVGLDTKLKLNRRAWIDFSYSFGLAPQGELTYYENYSSYNIDSISLLNCKLNLLLARRFGVSLGYFKETVDFDQFAKESFSGLTVGTFLRF